MIANKASLPVFLSGVQNANGNLELATEVLELTDLFRTAT